MDYKKLFDLTGKVCVVTGGMGYLGAENVKILKDFGATVVVTDIREAEDRWANASQAVGDMFVACAVIAINVHKQAHSGGGILPAFHAEAGIAESPKGEGVIGSVFPTHQLVGQ